LGRFISEDGYNGEEAAIYAATGWTLNFVPGAGQVLYASGWVIVIAYEGAQYVPAVRDWTTNKAIPWTSNAADDAFTWISNAGNDIKNFFREVTAVK
jgi:hypothetical protein